MTPEEARERRQAQVEFENARRDDDLRAALSHAWGRRLMQSLISRHSLNAATCTTDRDACQRLIGMGAVAERLDDDCLRVSPADWRRMHDEHSASVAALETIGQAQAQADAADAQARND